MALCYEKIYIRWLVVYLGHNPLERRRFEENPHELSGLPDYLSNHNEVSQSEAGKFPLSLSLRVQKRRRHQQHANYPETNADRNSKRALDFHSLFRFRLLALFARYSRKTCIKSINLFTGKTFRGRDDHSLVQCVLTLVCFPLLVTTLSLTSQQ